MTPEQVTGIVRGLSGSARRVGVFVKQSPEEIVSIMRQVGLDIVQLHRRASSEDVAAIRSAGYEVWTLAGGASGDGVLFDSSHGDGETVLRKGEYKGILAGGISVDNLAVACLAEPDVIDVSGSLESSRGVKSIPLLRAFIASWNESRRK